MQNRKEYNTVYLSTFSRLLMDNIYSGEKVKTKTLTDFCAPFFSMDPVPLNQNNAFCEVWFLCVFFLLL